MITPDSPIIGPASGSLHAALDWAGTENAEYVRELYRLCDLTGLDAGILFSQWAHETGDGQSYWWTTRRNPAGIGITGDPNQNDDSQTWTTQTDAARGHHLHMSAYVFGMMPLNVRFSQFNEWIKYDDRFDHVYNQPWAGKIRTIRDLTGKWATDREYHTKLCSKHAAIFGTTEDAIPADANSGNAQQGGHVSDTLVFGRVPYPDVIASHLPASNPYVVESGAPAVPDMVFWHRMIGTWEGTNGWFHAGKAATMYGVAVSATDGAAKAGSIYEWIKPGIGWYGESSGPAVAPYGDGALFVAEVGVAAVNRRSIAIEISGNYDTPLDPASRAAVVAITAFWADQKRIPWEQFPIVPGTNGRSFVGWHNEITGMEYKACPGAVVMAETPGMIADVRAALKGYQTLTPVPKPPSYAKPELPEWWEQSIVQSWPSDADHDGVRYRVARRNVEALKPAVRRSKPDAHAPKSGPNFLVREKANVERVLTGADRKQWILTADGHYVAASSFSPSIIVKPR